MQAAARVRMVAPNITSGRERLSWLAPVRHSRRGRDGAEGVFITIGELGHYWAGGVRQAPELLLGATTDTLVATDVVWEFFRAHPAR